jgi:hypothetical protein
VRGFANHRSSHPVGNGLVWGYGHNHDDEVNADVARLQFVDLRPPNAIDGNASVSPA